MRIGELARRAGSDVETVRFYERERLLDKPARESNGYRRYSDSQLAQLRFIRHCRSLDMGLAEIRVLLELQAHPELECDEINHLIDGHIVRIHQQVESLRLLEQQLLALRMTCRANRTAGECGILKNLTQASEGEACECHVDAASDGS